MRTLKPRPRLIRFAPLAACLTVALTTKDIPASEIALAAPVHPDFSAPAQLGGGSILPVTSCADDGSVGTLREVIGHAISGDTVDLSALSCSTITLQTGVIDVTVDDLTILGPGKQALTIDGNDQSLVLKHTGAGTLTVRALTVVNGHNTDDTGYTAPWICDYCTYIGGGGIYSSHDLAIENVAVNDCTVVASGTVTARGGGVYARNHLTVADSTFTGNTVAAEWVAMGGGAFGGRHVTMTSSRVSENTLGPHPNMISYGAGVAVACWYLDAQIEISGSEITANIATQYSRGGGVFVCGSSTFTNTTISNNVGGSGGGVGQNASVGSMSFVNSTISGNQAAAIGGGVLFYSAPPSTLSVSNSTVAFNTAGYYGGVGVMPAMPVDAEIEIQSSIVANNSPAGYFAADIGFFPDLSLVVTGSNNLVVDASPSVVLPGDTLSDDPQLLPLANNGGFSATHGLTSTSPAVDNGNNVLSLEFDQRGTGYARESGLRADIGAFEMQQVPEDIVFRDGFDG